MQRISEIKLQKSVVIDYRIEGVHDEKTAAAWVAALINTNIFKVDSAFYKKAHSDSLIGETSCRVNPEDYTRIFAVSQRRTADGIIFYTVWAGIKVIIGVYFDDYTISITVMSQDAAMLPDIESAVKRLTNSAFFIVDKTIK